MRTSIPLVLCALASLPLSGCLYPAERGRMLEERIDRLESEKKDLEQELKKQKAHQDELQGQLMSSMDQVEKSSRKTSADVGVQVEQMQTEITQLRGQLEQFGHQAGELQSAFDTFKAAVPAPQVGAEPGPDSKKPDAKKPEAIERPTDRKAFAELVEKTCADEPSAGRKLAEEWLRKFPKPDAAAEAKAWAPLAARVHFALGSVFMEQKEPRAALSEFGEIVKNHGKSEQAPDALLKSADCFAALKMSAESKLALEEIVNSYPKSEAAKTAKTRLADLKKAKPAAKKK